MTTHRLVDTHNADDLTLTAYHLAIALGTALDALVNVNKPACDDPDIQSAVSLVLLARDKAAEMARDLLNS